jgi:hypothetical protein
MARRSFSPWLIAMVLLALVPSTLALAQGGERTFPETGHTVRGRFLQFWQQQGGLPIFGYPLTEQIVEEGRDTQYFERRRFEAHPQNRAPYDVLLGRLGDELLIQRGERWQDTPPSQRRSECLWFSETGRNVCDQASGVGFRSYWASHGLEFDGRAGTSFAESLALFGLPLTEARMERNPDGHNVLTQWFERARFEWHPNNRDPHRVLLGRLGAEILQARAPGGVDRVNLYFIAVADAGRTGDPVGCDDSVVPVQVRIQPTNAPLTAAMQALLAVRTRNYGENNYYNALHQSELQVQRIVIENRVATVELSGTLRSGGVCDDPRIKAQLERTATQFPTVDRARILINGRTIDDILSLR